MSKNKFRCIVILCVSLLFPSIGHSKSVSENNSFINKAPVRTKQEQRLFVNPFVITLYEPTYVLPFIYTDKRNSLDTIPVIESLKDKLNKIEVNFKISFKVPIITNIFYKDSALFFAYTQISYWQAYCKTAFFRETDYKPEIFLSNNLNWSLGSKWKFQLFNVGFIHESNALGLPLEKSWNRIYIEGVASDPNWLISIRPWYIVRDKLLQQCNSDIKKYLGNGRLLVAYNYKEKTIALEIYNIEHGLKLTTAKLSYSFPLITGIKGYVQLFHGYGQSLTDYNIEKNSIGVGIALNDWI